MDNNQVVHEVLPDVVTLFLQKGVDYDGAHQYLGLAGQFSDINRKFWKLKRAMWDGEELSQEGLEEVLSDMIGHCLLSIAMVREGKHGGVGEGMGARGLKRDREGDGGADGGDREVPGRPAVGPTRH